MKRTKLIAALLLVTSLTSCMVNGKDGVTKAKTVKSGFMGLVTQDDIKVDTSDAFKGAKDVIIASFKVGFIDDTSSNAGRSIKASANIKLNGVNDSTKQEATEKAYNDFVAQLKANGYNIINKDKLYADKDFAGTKSYDTPYDDDGTKYFTPKSFGKLKFFAGDSPSFMGGFAMNNPVAPAVEYATKNNVKILSVTYLINFANAQGGGWTSMSALDVGQGITVAPGSKVALIGGQGGTFSTANGSISLGQPVSSSIEYGKLKNTNSDGYIAAETAWNVLATVAGGISMGQNRAYEIDANPAKYKEAVAEVLNSTNKAITSKMGSLK